MHNERRAFDAGATDREIIDGLAILIGKRVNEAKSTTDDIDDAALAAGHMFRSWLSELAYDSTFMKRVEQVIGDGFNSEFFVDGLTGEVQ